MFFLSFPPFFIFFFFCPPPIFLFATVGEREGNHFESAVPVFGDAIVLAYLESGSKSRLSDVCHYANDDDCENDMDMTCRGRAIS